MAYHEWGDVDFDFDRLNKAGRMIEDIYFELTGKYLIWKEKYGTIRFEFMYMWIKEKGDYENFITSILLVLPKFPDMIEEITHDFHFLEDKHWPKIKEILSR